MKLTNPWNRRVYRFWAPVYDRLFDRLVFAAGRRRAMVVLAPQAGERLLLLGVGTGADLPLLPAGVAAVGLDLSPEMLARAQARLPLAGRAIRLVQGDAQALPLEEGAFDAVVLNLVLSVVPDGRACFRQALAALKPAGRIVILDKFVPDGARPTPLRRLVNRATMLLGTDVTRRLGDILAGSPVTIVHDEASLLRGTYRIVLVRPQAKSDFIMPLSDAAADLAQVGGKGAALARLASAGLPVPDGFHITTAAYRRFVAENELQPRILAALQDIAPARPATFEAAAQTIGRLFAGATIPGDLAAAVVSAYAELGNRQTSTDNRQSKIGNREPAVAVRSSATAEDLPQASFAGQQETYLNIRGAEAVLEAVRKCWASLWTGRAIAYRARQGIAPDAVALAVVVQALVPAGTSGMLFTANPLTGRRDEIVINASWGLGEALVSGMVTPDTLTLDKASGRLLRRQIARKQTRTVPTETGVSVASVPQPWQQRPSLTPAQAAALARYGVQIEELCGRPMDIEWALTEGRLAILQARPITVLPEPPLERRMLLPQTIAARPQAGGRAQTFPAPGYDPVSGEWNDSLKGDYCWSSVNFREAAPDVMTPATWSLMWVYLHITTPIHFPGEHPAGGNIAGRLYFNLSLISSLYHAVGLDARREKFGDLLGATPPELNIPYLPFSPLAVVWNVLPGMIRDRALIRRDMQQFPTYTAFLREWCRTMRPRIQQCTDAGGLLSLWNQDIMPTILRDYRMLRSVTTNLSAPATRLNADLTALVGEAEARTLLSNLSGSSGDLASLEPLLGLARVQDGRMSREEYGERYGHRGPHEGELSAPAPSEDPEWLEKRLAEFTRAGVDVEALLARQHAAFRAAWRRLEARLPEQYPVLHRRLEQVAAAAKSREAFRSEGVRVRGIIRQFLLQAGNVTGTGPDIFFLSVDEMTALLAGDTSPLGAIAARRAMYQRTVVLPPYPAIIYGRFDPFQWAADPNRRSDFYDVRQVGAARSSAVKGFAGAAGCVEGVVRRIDHAEDGNQLQPGEILVTTITNIGWTPLFPLLAAIVTDVGAPLSHAAIVARELGIPAVVGCGNATMLLKTGDRVRVDGGRGTVEILTG